MKFAFDRTKLQNFFEGVSRVAQAKTDAVGDKGIHLSLSGNRLVATGTNSHIWIRSQSEVVGDEDGEVYVPDAKLIAEFLRRIDGTTVNARSEGAKLHLSSGRTRVSLQLSAEEPPADLDVQPFARGKIPSQELVRLCQMAFAASTDSLRPVLEGVLFEAENGQLQAVATDSYRLALTTSTQYQGDPAKFLLHRSLVKELVAWLRKRDEIVHIEVGERLVRFTWKDTDLRMALLNGQFPNWKLSVEQISEELYPYVVRFDRHALLETLSRASLISARTPVVRLHFVGALLHVHAEESSRGTFHEEVPIEMIKGDPELEIAFNANYLTEGISQSQDEKVKFVFKTGLAPAAVIADRLLYVVMPIRI